MKTFTEISDNGSLQVYEAIDGSDSVLGLDLEYTDTTVTGKAGNDVIITSYGDDIINRRSRK